MEDTWFGLPDAARIRLGAQPAYLDWPTTAPCQTAADAVRSMTTNQTPGIPARYPPTGEAKAESSWGCGWQAGSTERWSYDPPMPPGTFGHRGASGVFAWGEPSEELAGVICFYPALTMAERNEEVLAGAKPWAVMEPLDLVVSVVRSAVVG